MARQQTQQPLEVPVLPVLALDDPDAAAKVVATEKVSLTIGSDVLQQARERTGPRGLSAYATRALRRQLERDNLADLLDELVEENGPVDEAMVARYVEDWQ